MEHMFEILTYNRDCGIPKNKLWQFVLRDVHKKYKQKTHSLEGALPVLDHTKPSNEFKKKKPMSKYKDRCYE